MSQEQLLGRREFVMQATTAMSLVAATSMTGSAGESNGRDTSADADAENRVLSIKSASPKTFRVAVGQKVKVSGSQAEFTLDEVLAFKNSQGAKRPKGVRQEPFTLLLSAPAGVHLKDGTYTLSNAKLGKFDVFLNEVRLPSTFSTRSPLGQAERFLKNVEANVQEQAPRVRYQVVFN